MSTNVERRKHGKFNKQAHISYILFMAPKWNSESLKLLALAMVQNEDTKQQKRCHSFGIMLCMEIIHLVGQSWQSSLIPLSRSLLAYGSLQTNKTALDVNLPICLVTKRIHKNQLTKTSGISRYLYQTKTTLPTFWHLLTLCNLMLLIPKMFLSRRHFLDANAGPSCWVRRLWYRQSEIHDGIKGNTPQVKHKHLSHPSTIHIWQKNRLQHGMST